MKKKRLGNEIDTELKLGNIMVDCEDEKRLQTFYSELLGWQKCSLYGRPAVKSTNGIVFLFIEEADYIRPVWPEKAKEQQKQMHFDFQVPAIAEYVRKAKILGAVCTAEQFGGEDFVTMLDPSGHPFCLCKAD